MTVRVVKVQPDESTFDEPTSDAPIKRGKDTTSRQRRTDSEALLTVDKKGNPQLDVDDVCSSMVAALSDEEKETAARSSYRYFIASTSSEQKPSVQERDVVAAAMARRHLVAEKGNKKKALKKMKDTIKQRADSKVDEIRRCFSETESSNEIYSELRSAFEEEMATGKLIVRGYDKKQRALFHVFPRLENSVNPESYIKIYQYMLERAIACTERASHGREEKVIVMVDFKGYSKGNAPPLKVAKQMIFILRDHYPERLERVYLIDAPAIFRGFWTLLKPFVDPVTKKKFKFVTGEEQKRAQFQDHIAADQAMPYVLPEGTMTSPINVKEFLRDLPFDHAYDED